MYAKLFIRGNTGVREGEQNLAAAVAVHTLENLLAANTAHGEKLSWPDSVFSRKSEKRRRPRIPWTSSADRKARGRAPRAHAAGYSMEHALPSTSLHSS